MENQIKQERVYKTPVYTRRAIENYYKKIEANDLKKYEEIKEYRKAYYKKYYEQKKENYKKYYENKK